MQPTPEVPLWLQLQAMLASKEFDAVVQALKGQVAGLPTTMARHLKKHAEEAESHATTFRSHFNIFDGACVRECAVCASAACV